MFFLLIILYFTFFLCFSFYFYCRFYRIQIDNMIFQCVLKRSTNNAICTSQYGVVGDAIERCNQIISLYSCDFFIPPDYQKIIIYDIPICRIGVISNISFINHIIVKPIIKKFSGCIFKWHKCFFVKLFDCIFSCFYRFCFRNKSPSLHWTNFSRFKNNFKTKTVFFPSFDISYTITEFP